MVSHDVLHHFDGSYLRRVRAQVVVAPILLYLIWQGMRLSVARRPEPELDGASGVNACGAACSVGARRGLTPSITLTVWLRALQYFKPPLHARRRRQHRAGGGLSGRVARRGGHGRYPAAR